MISVRAILLAGLAIYLLPTDPAKQQQFKEHAATATHWAATWCDRNEQSCAVASGVWETMHEKAAFAATVAYDLASRQLSAAPASEAGTSAPAAARALLPFGRSGNLTTEDLRPAWRGHPLP